MKNIVLSTLLCLNSVVFLSAAPVKGSKVTFSAKTIKGQLISLESIKRNKLIYITVLAPHVEDIEDLDIELDLAKASLDVQEIRQLCKPFFGDLEVIYIVPENTSLINSQIAYDFSVIKDSTGIASSLQCAWVGGFGVRTQYLLLLNEKNEVIWCYHTNK